MNIAMKNPKPQIPTSRLVFFHSLITRHPSLITLLLLLITFHSQAQAPQSFSYQAVIRSADGELLREQKVSVRITILQVSEEGRPVFIETHDAMTNQNGLVSLAIGEGKVVDGSMEQIEWADGPFFVKTETDPRGGDDYSITGTTRLLSVPYALYAARSGNGGSPSVAAPNTVVVDADGNGDYLTITAALKNITPTAETPYTVFIMPGEYEENIQLIPHVTLQGAGSESVIIRGFVESANNEYVVKIEGAANVKLRSLAIASRNNGGQPSALFVKNSDVAFQNVHIAGDWDFSINTLRHGIVAEGSRIEFDGGKVAYLEFDGIILNQSEMKIQNTAVSAKNHGIDVENGSAVDVVNSVISDGVYTLNVRSGGKALVLGNQFLNSGIKNEGLLIMTGNSVFNSYSIGLINSGTATISDNLFNGCQTGAISENGPQVSTITGNIIQNTGLAGEAGLVVFNPNAVISNNVFHNNPFGDIHIASDVAGNAYISANVGALSGSIRRGKMAGIDDMFIERSNNNMLFILPEGGNLGMGTHEPTAPLHIVDGTANIRLGSNLDGVKSRLSFTDTSNQDTYIEKLDQGRLRFRVGGTNTRMTITQDGNVGIGTQNPTARLHTTGDVRLQGLAGEGSRMVVADDAGNLSAVKHTWQVGDFAHGGVVFYVEPCGTRGLVVSLEDLNKGAGLRWGKGGSSFIKINAKGDGLYAGKRNTSLIISVQAAKDYFDDHAALVCANFDGGGYGDWYLPSIAELVLVFENRPIIEKTALANGGNAFSHNTFYWTSNEGNDTQNREVFGVNFSNGAAVTMFKGDPLLVRAVRAF